MINYRFGNLSLLSAPCGPFVYDLWHESKREKNLSWPYARNFYCWVVSSEGVTALLNFSTLGGNHSKNSVRHWDEILWLSQIFHWHCRFSGTSKDSFRLLRILHNAFQDYQNFKDRQAFWRFRKIFEDLKELWNSHRMVKRFSWEWGINQLLL